MDNPSVLLTFTALSFWFSLGIILYTYIGYPLFIAILAIFRPAPKKYENSFPAVTLLIAAYNEELVIENKIRNSLSIEYPKTRLQILVVTDGSSDQTPEIVGRFTDNGVELLHQPERRGKMAAINRAIPRVRGEIIVFSDANNYYQPDTLSKLIAPFSDKNVGAVSGSKVIDQGDGNLGASEGLYWKYESFIKKQESRLGSCTSVSGEIFAIRKELYSQPPDNIINDDFYIGMQAIRKGYRLAYAPEARSIEQVSLSAKDEITRRTRINAGRYQAISLAGQVLPLNNPLLVWQIISHKFLRPLVPFCMIGAALFNVMLVLLPHAPQGIGTQLLYLGRPIGHIILALQTLFYLLAWIGAKYTNRRSRSKLARLLYLPSFLTNSNFAALKGFFQFLRGKQSHIWERIPRR